MELYKDSPAHRSRTKVCAALLILIATPLLSHRGSAGTYALTGEQGHLQDPDNDVDFITYPIGYAGQGATLTITVGIKPDSPNGSQMETSLKNAIKTWNQLRPLNGNVVLDESLADMHDFESVCLHELDHAMGLDHPNLGNESNLSGFTNSVPGPNEGDLPDLDIGADNVQGSSDDLRGDDINRNWFRKNVNNPFTISSIVDSTTYSRDLADLPDTLPSQTFFSGVSGSNVGLEFRSTQDIATGDVDGDGDVDVVAGDQSTPVRLYLNNATTDPFDGVTGSDIGPADSGIVMAIALGDLDLDGDLDVVVGRDTDPNLIYFNNGSSSPFSGVSGTLLVAQSHLTTAIVLGDIDGDNDLDIIEGISQARNRLYLNNGNGSFASAILIGAVGDAFDTTSFALGDIDRDGDLDLVEGNFAPHRNKFYRNSSGTFDAALDIGTQTDSTQSVALADLNRDGLLDFIVGNNGVNRFYRSSVLPNPFSGVIPLNITTDDNNTTSIAAADVNFDGVPDVVAGNTSNETNRLYINNAISNPADPFAGVTGSDLTDDAVSTRAVEIVDIDNDGDRDVVAGNFGQRNRLYLNNGPIHNYAANANRAVSVKLLPILSESVMSAGSVTDETQRSLGFDDVATMRYAMTGLDEIFGTSDDFSYELKFVGFTESANIVLDFDSTQIPIAAAIGFTQVTAQAFGDHYRLTNASIFIREESPWFFNPTLDNATVFADFAHSGIEDGTEDFPFDSVAEALAEVADGGTIIFSPGASPETPTIDQDVTLMAAGPSTLIGLISARNIGADDAGADSTIQRAMPVRGRTGFVASPR